MKITFTDKALDYLKRREILNKILILIADDGGGKYSIKGGGCAIPWFGARASAPPGRPV